jgi:crossover junction endodeoxyribonuclease RuvC
MDLPSRLLKLHDQMELVVKRFEPTCLGIETIWFGANVTAGILTSQARGAVLVACASQGLSIGEFTPKQIKLAVVGEGNSDKTQVQYMVKQLLSLDDPPHPDHAADALAAAICYVTHGPRTA